MPAFLEIDGEHVSAADFTGKIGVPHDLVRRDALLAPQVDHGDQIDASRLAVILFRVD